MFKTPEWEDDVPVTHTSFLINNKKQNKITVKNKASLKENKVKGTKQIAKSKETPKANNIVENKISLKTYASNVNNDNKKQDNLSTTSNKKLSKKHKLDNKINNKKKTQSNDVQGLNKMTETQNFDEIILNAKNKKFNEVIENDDKEELLFFDSKTNKKKKRINKDSVINNNVVKTNGFNSAPINTKKNKLRAMIESQANRRHINIVDKSNKLRERMLERLKAAQFRYLNEKLYTSSGSEAQQLFQNDPTAFETYHQGYQLQVKKWPVNPLDVIVKRILKMPKSHLIADMGCGEASLSLRIPHTVRSFDLVATAPGVEACDMARTPLLTSSVDVAVYCLALMGTDLTQYLLEANRILKLGGHLLIAEVESRFDNVDNFGKDVQRLGFKLKQLDKSNKVFFFMEFTKVTGPPVKKAKLPKLTLKPCLYKKR